MPYPENCFTLFDFPTDEYTLPSRFTFVFYYQPHPLCLLAAKQLQQKLQQAQWPHNFGLGDDPNKVIGKMFGVLVVQNTNGEIGFLSAFSGKLAETNHLSGFVPPVFDNLANNSFFIQEQRIINQLNQQIELLEQDCQLITLKKTLDRQSNLRNQALASQRSKMIETRRVRKIQRQQLQTQDVHKSTELLKQLSQQSIEDKRQLKNLALHWDQIIQLTQQPLCNLKAKVDSLKTQRKNLSAALQQKLFAEYRFLNQHSEEQNLQDIFKQTAMGAPPAGAGECAAPKLLQYAFEHGLKPIAMAEFWWGAAPKSAIRRHKQFYPACMGKCQPILAHMLAGIDMDPNPLLINQGKDKHLDIIYKDEHMLIVNKPAELLSVPGKQITDSVYQRIKNQFPLASGPLIVHRLDMSTSGLMVIALTSESHKNLQRQFIQRTVKKCYFATLEGIVDKERGTITLPLRGDFYDRPRQLVCHKDGKPAVTHWQVIERDKVAQRTKIYLYPKTGRTHQLRVHCAHVSGLNMPIVGDDLYGKNAKRLHLHAQKLKLQHPISQKWLDFELPSDFTNS
jgi:tRNA pseudouridine32 synthase/23S rRNA pseudouridine746 synthase